MNKLKYLFLLVCCAAFIGGTLKVAAQTTDSILVSAKGKTLKQSDIDKLIQFYEWAFQSEFNSTQKADFQEYTEEEFRSNPAESRKTIDDIVTTLPQILAAAEDVQADTRKNFLAAFLPELQKGTDANSQMLLKIYESRENGEKVKEVLPDKEDSLETPKPSAGKGAGGASKLVGVWTRSDGAGGFRDYTGKTKYNSGTDTAFEFFADGTMRFTVKKETLSITQCQISENTVIPGTYQVSGSRLTLNLGAGSVVGKSSCEKSGNFNKKLSASSLTKTFVVKELESVFRPDRPLILCLDGAADDQCFERDPKR